MVYAQTGRPRGRPRGKTRTNEPVTLDPPPIDLPTDSTPTEAPFPHDREIDKAAKELADKHALPRPPGKQLDWDEMQSYFGLLTPEMWSHLTVYLYRLRPRIIRQLKDPSAPNYVDCIGEPFSMEYITERHGGGKYMIECTDNTVARRGQSMRHLFRCFFNVDEIRHEPKLNYEELDIHARENLSYIQMLQHRGILDAKGQVMQPNQSQPNYAAGVNADVIEKILGFVSKLNSDQQTALHARLTTDKDDLSKSVGNILLEKMKQDDPSKQVQMLSSLLTALKEIVGTSKSDGNSALYDKIITMQAEHNKTVLQLIERITQNRKEENPESPDEFDRLGRVLEFAEKLSSLRGGGGGHRNGWDIGLDYAKELGLPLMQTITNMLSMRRGGPPIPINGNPGAPGAFDPYANPAALREHANAVNARQPPPQQPPSMPMGTATASTPLLQLFQQYGGLVVNALNSRTRGFEFADYLCGLFGDSTHAMIAGNGEQTLVETMMAVPDLAIFGETRLKTFVHEFVAFEEFLKEQPEEGEPVQ